MPWGPSPASGLPDSEKGPDRHRHPLLVPEAGSDQKFAVLEVTDQGPGIAREHLPRLTERFYRVEGQKSGERSGTGLGLAIVKHITNRHGGGLQVDSALGHGSSFTVWLPQKPQLRDVQPARPSL
jgi:two-component system phosphate regulon sensor histidine kinase PhoR